MILLTPVCRERLFDLFSQIEKEFEQLYASNLACKYSVVPNSTTFSVSISVYGCHHLVGIVVKVSASRAEVLRFESRLRQDFSGSSHVSDLEIGTPVATLPGA